MNANRILFGAGFLLALGAVGSADSAGILIPAVLGLVGALTMLLTASHLKED